MDFSTTADNAGPPLFKAIFDEGFLWNFTREELGRYGYLNESFYLWGEVAFQSTGRSPW